MKLTPRIKIWLSTADNHTVFGSGRFRLLCAIEEFGSLAAAAEKLNISYRKAWGDLKESEKNLNVRLIIKTRGGSGGGKTQLTPEGKRLTQSYAAFADEVKRFSKEAFANHLAEVLPK